MVLVCVILFKKKKLWKCSELFSFSFFLILDESNCIIFLNKDYKLFRITV